MVLVNKERYLKLQLIFSIINSIVMFIIGVITTVLNVTSPNIVLVPLIVHIISYLLNFIVRKKGYVQY